MEPLVSVIVPVYNKEKFIERTIRGLLSQTYQNIEIIFVNDGSTENEKDIILYYAENDKRIRYIECEKNLGLVRCRLRGVKASQGNYIMFMDSDDYVNRDFVRLLVQTAEKTNADMVFSSTVEINALGEKKLLKLQDTELNRFPLKDEEILESFFDQSGSAYLWHTIWNKLYSKKLWEKAIAVLEEIDQHIVMYEDLLFSAILFYYAKSIDCAKNSVYFYDRHGEGSTQKHGMKFDAFSKHITDLINVITFIEKFYEDKEKRYRECVQILKKVCVRNWRIYAEHVESEKVEQAKAMLYQCCDNYEDVRDVDSGYFGMIQISYDETLEHIKEKIIECNAEYISFDMFDTLVTRPFWKPTDLFYILDEEYEKWNVSANVGFCQIRIEGEIGCRNVMQRLGVKEDVTLDEIYDYIAETYAISREVCSCIKKREMELEVELSLNRDTVHELYDLAVHCGKKVIIISDMYLPEECIAAILKKNGYVSHAHVFVSSKYGVLKKTGNLFRKVQDILKVDSENIIHIGDNLIGDIEVPKALGIETIYIPKCTEVFEQKNRCANIGKVVAGGYRGEGGFEKVSGYGSMAALVANKYFDNPFRTFGVMSDFNTDPYFMGYYLLGMNVIAQIMWLESIRETNYYGRLLFTSRDGYLLYQAYDIYKNVTGNGVDTKYVYVSRRSMLPAMLKEKTDFYFLPIVYRNYSPRMILDLLAFCTDSYAEEKLISVCEDNSLSVDKKFSTVEEYHRFMTLYLEYWYSREKHDINKEPIVQYFSDVKSDDAIYDMGYSASIHSQIVKVSEAKPLAVFVHRDHVKSNVNKRRNGFEIECFMKTMPNVSGVIREYLFSDTEGSCVGYRYEGDELVPVLEDIKPSYTDTFAVRMMHKGALDFCRDYFATMSHYLPYMDYQIEELALPFEGFLSFCKREDLKVFKSSYYEDKVYGAHEKINVMDFWVRTLSRLPQYDDSTVMKRVTNLINENQKKGLALFGTGKVCGDILKRYPQLPISVFLDNDENKWDKERNGIKICKPCTEMNLKQYYIIISCDAISEICKQFEELGLEKYRDYISYKEIL